MAAGKERLKCKRHRCGFDPGLGLTSMQDNMATSPVFLPENRMERVWEEPGAHST